MARGRHQWRECDSSGPQKAGRTQRRAGPTASAGRRARLSERGLCSKRRRQRRRSLRRHAARSRRDRVPLRSEAPARASRKG
eukprot:6187136-Pleurochrysis_carterae.AAC.2